MGQAVWAAPESSSFACLGFAFKLQVKQMSLSPYDLGNGVSQYALTKALRHILPGTRI